MSDPSQPWLESARRSLDAAEVLHSARRWPQTCFHAQQAAELALKAAIAHQNVAPPRFHSITELLARQDSAVRQALDYVADDLRGLDRYYTATRYPDAIVGALPEQQEADEALIAAEEGVTVIERLLGASP